jgi:hypothetical protein
MFTCKCPTFTLDAYIHSPYMRSGLIKLLLPYIDACTSWIRITSFLHSNFHLSTSPHFGPDPIACRKLPSPLFSTLQ